MLQAMNGGSRAAALSKLAIEQAAAAIRTGNPVEAEQVLRKHLIQHGSDAAAILKLAELVIEQGRVEETTALLRRAAGIDVSVIGRMALLRHLHKFCSPELVLLELESWSGPIRSRVEVLTIEAAVRGLLGDQARQIEIYRRLALVAPKDAALWKNLGDALKTVGRIDEAVDALRKAVEIRPTYGEAWWTLANFKSVRFEPKDVATMRKALRSDLTDADALHFHFALGQAYEARGEFEQSFKHYDWGNQIRRKGLPAEAMRVTGFVDRAIATYTPKLFIRHRNAGCDARDPIFVLGLHRSGSTLVEQILASHSMIEGTAELAAMHQIWERIGRLGARQGRSAFEEVAVFEGSTFQAIGEEYLDRTRAFRTTDRPFFVDKLPANWLNLGLIRLALPNARIVDARRHPMACGFSNLKQNYASGVTFSYSQESIGWFYRDYVRYMEHIEKAQPGAVHRVINEKLIEDPEGETRKLLEFIGVPFEPQCLAPHLTKRAVQTPSAEQVRRPINRDGVAYWRNYEPWLEPMKAALGPVMDSWDLNSA